MGSDTQQALAARILRESIRNISHSGLSYEQMSDLIDSKYGWNAGSIKQFAYRETNPRITPKLVALAEFVSNQLHESRELAEKLSSADLRLLDQLAESHNESEPISSRGIYDQITKRSLSIFLPDKLAFARFGREEKKIVVVLLTIKKGVQGYEFTMKISGDGRRIVVGDVLHTTINTYFTGFAFPINKKMTNEEFSALDAFDIESIHKMGAHNELGIESLVISNSDLSYSIMPAVFCGLDGMGRPKSGTGIVFSDTEFSRFNVEPQVFSSVSCSKNSGELQKALRKAGASTVLPPNEGAYGLQKALNEQQLDGAC